MLRSGTAGQGETRGGDGRRGADRRATVGLPREEEAALVAGARDGDDRSMARLADHYRHDLLLHCYRMLGNMEEAAERVRAAFALVWREFDNYPPQVGFNHWVFRVATLVCLGYCHRNQKRRQLTDVPVPFGSSVVVGVQVPWLQPCPDPVINQAADRAPDAAAADELRRSVELASIAALQHLPPTQRAVLIHHEMLQWSLEDCAKALSLSMPSLKHALQQGRDLYRKHLAQTRDARVSATRAGTARRSRAGATADQATEDRVADTAVLRRYVRALEDNDELAARDIVAVDAQVSHQPGAAGNRSDQPLLYGGPKIHEYWAWDARSVRLKAVQGPRANGLPVIVTYIQREAGEDFTAFSLAVVRFEKGQLKELANFGPALIPIFGLPSSLPADDDDDVDISLQLRN